MASEKFNVKIDSGFTKGLSDRERMLRGTKNLHPIYLHDLVVYIKNKISDTVLCEEIIKMAGECPHSALGSFFSKIDLIIADKREQLNKRSQKEKELKQDEILKEITKSDILDLQEEIFNQNLEETTNDEHFDAGVPENMSDQEEN